MTSPTPTSDARVELLGWSGCPSHDAALDRLRTALRELGRPDEPVVLRWIETDEDAAASRFIGSPTIRVDGVDIVEPGDGEQFGLTCRVYRTADGRFSPLPDYDVVVGRLGELFATAHPSSARARA